MVKMPSGQFAAMNELSVELLEVLSQRTTPPGSGGWPEGATRIYLSESLFFIVTESRILQLYASTSDDKPKDESPVFKRKGSDKEYSLHFSHQQMIELLGQPRNVNDVWQDFNPDGNQRRTHRSECAGALWLRGRSNITRGRNNRRCN